MSCGVFLILEREATAAVVGERMVGIFQAESINDCRIAIRQLESRARSGILLVRRRTPEDVIYALSRIPGIKVIGRTSVFALKGIAYDVRDTGVRLGAGTVIDGSVRRSGSSIRIFAEMIDAETRQVRWADTFNRTMEDVFSVQAEIAQTIARVLQMELTPPVSGRLIRGAPSMDAYLLYLRGRYAWNRMSTSGFEMAVDTFERAIAEFPTYASPLAGLADAYVSMAMWGEIRLSRGVS